MKTLIILFLGLTFFQTNLTEFDSKYLDNSIVIVLDGIFCSGCYDKLLEVSHVWKDDYKSVVAVSSIRDKPAARRIYAERRRDRGIDSVILIEKNNWNDSLFIDNKFVDFMRTPVVIISTGEQKQIIWYDELFGAGIDTNNIKRVISKRILKEKKK